MLRLRKANNADALLYYEWANEETVRRESFNSELITLEEHTEWFEKKITDPECMMLIFEDKNSIPAGQVRLQKVTENEYVIGISVDISYRGKGFAVRMLTMASDYFFEIFPQKKINAFIKIHNTASVNAFEKAGFINPRIAEQKGIACFMYTKENGNANS